MRTLKTCIILGLAVLLLGFTVGCDLFEAKSPASPDIQGIIDNPDNNNEDDPLSEENYPSEIVGEYYGTPLTLTGNRFEITLKSVEFKRTIQGVSGNIWNTTKYGFVIFRYKVKNLLEKSPQDPSKGPPFPIWCGWVEGPGGTEIYPEENSGFENDCFPGEKYCDGFCPLHPQEESDFVSAVAIPEHALTFYLTIGFTDSEFTDKTQSFRFRLQFRIQDII